MYFIPCCLLTIVGETFGGFSTNSNYLPTVMLAQKVEKDDVFAIDEHVDITFYWL